MILPRKVVQKVYQISKVDFWFINLKTKCSWNSYIMECHDGVCYLPSKGEKKGATPPHVPLPQESDPWTVYGASWCGFCRRAKKFLETEQQPLVYYDVDELGGGQVVKDALRHLIGNHNTVPIVFHKQKLIGGFSELKEEYPKLLLMNSKAGGFSEEKEVTEEVVTLANQFKEEVEKVVNKDELDRYEPSHYRSQVVAGLNYRIRVKVSDKKAVHLHVFKPLPHTKEEPQLKQVLYPKTHDEEL